ncbi:hypothetical protein B7P43_G01149 [Cryptotermes secundus]|uniref:Plastocyanin-like domain-containing protein n=1 Tax=Cryptotermes secundus TaxID=105785 RepID=A0A2J7QZS8_9NEOP|nr:hypothetical protein B7P43_G01149 [Cryptotermes secundus]
MCCSKSLLMISVLLQVFSHGFTSISNESVTTTTRKEIQPSERLNHEMDRYSILVSDSATRIHNMTLSGSPQTLPSDMIDFSVLLSPQSDDGLDKSSLLEPYDGFKYSAVSSPNKIPDKPFIHISSTEDNNSTESIQDSPPSYLNDKKQSPSVPSSNITVHPLNSKDVTKFNATKHEISSTSSSSDSNRRMSNIRSGNKINSTTLSESYEEITTSSTSDSKINGVQTLSSQKDNAENISNLRREEAISLPASTTNIPITHTIQHSPVSHADSYSNSHTSEISVISSDSSDTNTRPFPVDTTMAVLLPQNATNYRQNEESQHSIISKAHSFQQLNNFTVSNFEPNIGTDSIITSDNTDHPFVSETVANSLPTHPTSNKNLKHPSDKEVRMISLPTYHPNDVIHFSSSELYPSDSIHNTSHEEKHPCARTCKEGSPPMVCRYRFQLEWYYTMSKACYNCPVHLDDCNRKDCVVADGVRRPVVVVNRQMPGPSVEVCKGDQIIVDMENYMMEESTTIHWHGHHQRGTPYMDGVPYVTQCPIPPKSSFRYHYTADTPGTHFWHSHSGCQRADGAFGALIVRVPSSSDPHRELYDRDLSEHTVQILDWDDKLGVDKFLAHHHANGNNKPKTLLVNGRGRFHQFQDVNFAITNVTHSPTATFAVQQVPPDKCRLPQLSY